MFILWLPLVLIVVFFLVHLIALLAWLSMVNLVWILAFIPSIRKLILKHSKNSINNPSHSFENKGNITNNRSNHRRYAQYIHASLIDFGYVACRAWGWKRSCPFKPSQGCQNACNHGSSKNVNNTSKELLIKKLPDVIHDPSLAEEKSENNQIRT